MSEDKKVEINENELSDVETEQTETCDCEESTDDRLIELEIFKEMERVEREKDCFEWVSFPEEDDKVSKEICRDADAYANFYTRLVLAGIHSDTASQLLMNYMTTRHNIEVSKIEVEKAKYVGVQIDKTGI